MNTVRFLHINEKSQFVCQMYDMGPVHISTFPDFKSSMFLRHYGVILVCKHGVPHYFQHCFSYKGIQYIYPCLP